MTIFLLFRFSACLKRESRRNSDWTPIKTLAGDNFGKTITHHSLIPRSCLRGIIRVPVPVARVVSLVERPLRTYRMTEVKRSEYSLRSKTLVIRATVIE